MVKPGPLSSPFEPMVNFTFWPFLNLGMPPGTGVFLLTPPRVALEETTSSTVKVNFWPEVKPPNFFLAANSMVLPAGAAWMLVAGRMAADATTMAVSSAFMGGVKQLQTPNNSPQKIRQGQKSLQNAPCDPTREVRDYLPDSG